MDPSCQSTQTLVVAMPGPFKWSVAWCHAIDAPAANNALEQGGFGPNSFSAETTNDAFDESEVNEDGEFLGQVSGWAMWGLFSQNERQDARQVLSDAGFVYTTDTGRKEPGVINFADYDVTDRDKIEEEDEIDGFLARLLERRPGKALEAYAILKANATDFTYAVTSEHQVLTQWDETILINMETQGANFKPIPGEYEFAGRYVWDDVDGHEIKWGIRINGEVTEFIRTRSPFQGILGGIRFDGNDLVTLTYASDTATELTILHDPVTKLRFKRTGT